MKLVACAAVASSLLAPAAANPYLHVLNADESLRARDEPANQPNGYTPQTVTCPSATPTIRAAGSLSDNETQWTYVRRNATVQPMRDLLGRLNITGLDTDSWIDMNKNNASALPNIGIAASGGGYRAMLNGAGHIQAFDSRTPDATGKGGLGGLLQSATYLAGLSGGSWLVGSLYANNMTSISDILAQDTSGDTDSTTLWQLENSIFEGPDDGDVQLLDTADYYKTLVDQVEGKQDAGFNITITDIWGRALSFQLINATDGGPAYTFSSLASQEWFTNGSQPLPLIVADSRSPGQVIVSGNSTIFEFSPFEFGSHDPTTYGFAPTYYLGTNFNGGSPETDQCIVGYDNAGFIYGTSSTLFNEGLIKLQGINTTSVTGALLKGLVTNVLSDIGEAGADVADWVNPFYHYDNGSNVNAAWPNLTLTDGGEDGQNIPLYPLIQPDRNVDVIFAIDSSADTTSSKPADGSAANWPLGEALVATYERSLSPMANGTSFPAIPDINTFVNLGLNNRPTFFGCNASNTSSPTPLIVYLPNAPYVYDSNVSTYDLHYNDSQRNAIIANAYNGATQGNGTLDSEWGTCVGCAILSRSLDRTGTTVPDVCNSCFNRYCWNGTVDSTTPAAYAPKLKIQSAEVNVTGSGSGSSGSSGGKKSAAPGGYSSSSTVLALGAALISCLAMI